MGYEIHITRKENWLDENLQNDISLQEWKEYVKNDFEMSLENVAETTTPNNSIIRIEREGLTLWNGHSNFDKVWFSWFNGRISVNKPDDEIIGKILKIAKSLNAKVLGDEGESYSK